MFVTLNIKTEHNVYFLEYNPDNKNHNIQKTLKWNDRIVMLLWPPPPPLPQTLRNFAARTVYLCASTICTVVLEWNITTVHPLLRQQSCTITSHLPLHCILQVCYIQVFKYAHTHVQEIKIDLMSEKLRGA